jgi:Terminase large subunit, T4likevirus-type, N-terminal/Terminase RNaseH-like domain
MGDPVYFIGTYCQIEHPVKGGIQFDMYDYQIEMVRTFHRSKNTIALSARQTGKSATAAAYLLWFAIFKFEKTILIASNKNDNAMEMIRRCKFMYERLPMWLKPGLNLDGYNKHEIGFDNGSRIISQATTENTGRGLAISLLFLDEFAFVRDNVAVLFWTSISPTLATGGDCIITSTPNGDSNLFAQMWRGANIPNIGEDGTAQKEGINGYIPIEVKWDAPPGRDDKFRKEETAKIGETRFRQEYLCEFISNDPLLIDSLVLQNLGSAVDNVVPIGTVSEIVFFKRPVSGNTYLVGMDVSTGSGKDYTTIEVFEFPSMEQIAEFRSNTMSPALGYNTLKRLLKLLEQAGGIVYFSVENNGVGESIIALYDADETPPDSAEFVSEAGTKRMGMSTTGKSKMRACLSLKEMIERTGISIKSKVLVAELKNFIRTRGSYAAKTGATDDLIMATVIALRCLEQLAQYDQTAYDKLYSQSYIPTEEGGYDHDEQGLGILF